MRKVKRYVPCDPAMGGKDMFESFDDHEQTYIRSEDHDVLLSYIAELESELREMKKVRRKTINGRVNDICNSYQIP